MQNGQHRAITDRIQKLVGMPCGGEGSGLRLAISHDAAHHEVWIVEGGAKRMGQRITELAAFIDRAGDIRRAVTGNATRKRELLEQAPHPLDVLADIGIHVTVASLEIRICHECRATMAGTYD